MTLNKRERLIRWRLNKLGPEWLLIKNERAEPGATVILTFDRDLGPESEVDVAGHGFDVKEKELPIIAWSLFRIAAFGDYTDYKVFACVEWEGRETPVSALAGPPHWWVLNLDPVGAKMYSQAAELKRHG